MDFWEAQKKARGRTSLYLFVFVLLGLLIGMGIEYVVRFLAAEGAAPPVPYLGIIFFVITSLVALFYYMSYKGGGGSFVAESLGGKRVKAGTGGFEEAQLLNIVEEMSIASGMPVPPAYIIESKEINAFAAGINPKNAAIAITRGALHLLDRDEVEGVIAHEFGHIYNGDMKISMRLSAMIMGFTIILYLGMRLLQSSMFFGGRDRREGGGTNPLILVSMVFLVAGAITWFAGAILRSMVSRQREFLADACAVQFTRNASGISSALRKIAKHQHVNDMPKHGMAYAHLYFDNHSFWSSLFATHPPLAQRIAAIEGHLYTPSKEGKKQLP